MLPNYLRDLARRTAKKKAALNLAIFGPGRGSPFFEKRRQTFEIIEKEYPEIKIKFYLIDDLQPQTVDYADYISRVYPAEIAQIKEADIILFLLTHHKLTALVEFGLLHTEGTNSVFDKCGLAVIDNLEVSKMWFDEARRLMQNNADRLISFSEHDLVSCRLASDKALELFERVLIEQWADI